MCGDPVVTNDQLPPEIRDKVYKPEPGEQYDVDVDLTQAGGFGE